MSAPGGRTPGIGAIALISALIAVGPMTFSIFPPAIPATARDLGVSAAAVQATLSAYLVVMGLSQPVYGPIADRFGRKRPMLVGFVLFVAGSILCALSHDTTVMMAGRVAQALGVCAGMVSGRALARDWFGPERTAVAMAGITASVTAAPALAPLLGGFLSDTVGWRGVFWALAAYGALMLAIAIPLVPDMRSSAAIGTLRVGAAYARLFGSRRYMGVVLTMSLQMGAFFGFTAEAPFLLTTHFGLSNTGVGFFFMAPASGYVMGSMVAIRLNRFFRPATMIHLGNLGSALVVLWPVVKYLAGDLTMPDLLVGVVGLSFLQGFCFPQMQAIAIGFDPRIVGTASGLMGTIQMVVCGISVLVTGLIHDGSAGVPVFVLCVPIFVSGLVGTWAVRTGK